jgi:hypothetical protein
MRMLPAELLAVASESERDKARQAVAFTKFIYILVHPEDERPRGEALATMTAEALGRYQADPENLVARGLELLGLSLGDLKFKDEATARKWIDDVARESLSLTARELFVPAGGFSAVATAKGTDYILSKSESNLSKFFFAGLALCTLYQLANHQATDIRGGASMGKVWWLLEKGSPIKGPKDIRQMKRQWEEYRNVAHLGAAAFLLWKKRGKKDDDTLFMHKELSILLKIAKRSEDFGTTFKPEHMRDPSPVLDPEMVWRVPVDASADDEHMPGGLPLRVQLLLASYKAPRLA